MAYVLFPAYFSSPHYPPVVSSIFVGSNFFLKIFLVLLQFVYFLIKLTMGKPGIGIGEKHPNEKCDPDDKIDTRHDLEPSLLRIPLASLIQSIGYYLTNTSTATLLYLLFGMIRSIFLAGFYKLKVHRL